ncbi:GntR family transcriptional regulator [Hansschlegelia zhihuaiae]|uniref:GntR family transcriptional regulator n=1 Tax=Hansschlegelia zhihuaiae TaxID=405005 RepID=UPI0013E8A0D8|nr:GntR family transcriptional regulator [Hansschlegelia zhihuaiae]
MPIARDPTLRARVFEVVATAIGDRSLRPGSVLLEAVVADALSTSRSPVRAALEQLRAHGRVKKLAGRGYVVLDAEGRSPARRVKIDRTRFLTLAPRRPERRTPAWLAIVGDLQGELAAAAVIGPLRIIEGEVARQYQVSRTVVRDVLSRIELIGLIEKDDRLRWRLVPLTAQRAAHLQELRRALEPLALRGAAENGAFDGSGAMRERLSAARSRVEEVGSIELQGFERELHVDAFGRCGNPEVMKALRSAHVQLTANHKLYQRLTQRFPTIIAEHLEIVDRLAEHDVEGGVAALERHLAPGRISWLCDAIEAAAKGPEPLPAYLTRD